MSEWRHLVQAAQGGDIEAFDGIVREFQDMAVGYAFSVLGDFGHAEDAAQEAFIQAYRDLHSLNEPQAFPAWLRRLVYKHCDRQTRGKRVRTVPLDAAQDAASKGPDPMQSSERGEFRERVLQVVNALPEHERTAVSLFYINGYSQAEVGEFLDVPAKTIKSRLHSARGKLRERMMEMVEETLHTNGPDESFAERVTRAIRTYTAKGPAEDSTGSETDMAMRAQTAELLESGDEGFDIAVALSESDQAKARIQSAVYFGVKGDPKGKKHLARLLRDDAASVRSRALRWLRAWPESVRWLRYPPESPVDSPVLCRQRPTLKWRVPRESKTPAR